MKPQKAKHYHLEKEKRNPHYTGKDYLVFEKHDGWYGYIDPGDVVRSRAMRAVPSLDWMTDIFKPFNLQGRLVFEVLVNGMPEFKDLNGYLNRQHVGGLAYLRVHDYVVDGPFSYRWERVKQIVAHIDSSYILPANYIGMAREPEWQGLAKAQWAMGREGIILKEADAEYKPGSRTGSLLKIKEELTLDMLVTGACEGEGKYVGMLGSLQVQEADGTTHLVGGMTDEQRYRWWAAPSLIMDKVVEIKAMKRLSNGALREPRFKAIRYDKHAWEID